MQKNQKIVLILAIIISIPLLLLTEGVFYAGIVMLIAVALIMSLAILESGGKLAARPEVTCFLREDAKAVVVRNRGDAEARDMHVALVPLNIEFDVPPLPPGESYEFALPSMIGEAKAAITYRSPNGRSFSETKPLSALHPVDKEEDLLKPMFPMFEWKKE
ncbi:MAG: hypothetical protein APR53_07835 [Methanoculleus sp. SDB]|nr:MAG: hypothetical protein APR53_07835 [Methanoculleus sp. SDB]